jgi:hypothetical protein
MLYDRDYKTLTAKEQELWEQAEEIINGSRIRTAEMLNEYYGIMPKAALHHRELFPNNYLDIDDLKDKELLWKIQSDFLALLDGGANERDVLSYIRNNKYYFIVGAIFRYNIFHFNFGHHNAFLFKEFPLSTNHIADYLLIGKNSNGYNFIFVEFESPTGRITTSDGDFGEVIRKGISQVNDWRRWLMANYSSLSTEFDKHIGSVKKNLPREFYKFDRGRMHYVVVAGRRTDYKDKTYILRGEIFKDDGITLLHYDNLLDGIHQLRLAGHY